MLLTVAKRKSEPTEFGLALRRLREAAGMTQEQLSAATGIRAAAISRLEVSPAANPTWDTVTRLAVALGVKPDAFGV